MRRMVSFLGLLAAVLLAACSESFDDPMLSAPDSPVRRELEESPQGSMDGTCYLKDGDIWCEGVSGTGFLESDCKYLYFNCPDDTGSGGSSFWGEGGGSTGSTTGSTGGKTGLVTGTCDPSADTTCHKPLTTADTAMIRKALKDYVRPASEIADTTARRQCDEMRRQFENSLDAGKVFRGGSDSPTSTSHYGATYQGSIHFDPWLLASALGGNTTAQREVANTALHEAAHVMGKQHPAGPTLVNGHDVYSDPYFDLLSPGPKTCIKF